MKKARGYLITHDPAFACPLEVDTFTCCHYGSRPDCQGVVDKPPFQQASVLGGYCHKCDAPTCANCAGKPCMPAEKWCDLIEQKLHYSDLVGR